MLQITTLNKIQINQVNMRDPFGWLSLQYSPNTQITLLTKIDHFPQEQTDISHCV